MDAEIACILAAHLRMENGPSSKAPEPLPSTVDHNVGGAGSNSDEVAPPYVPIVEAARSKRLAQTPHTPLERVGSRWRKRATPTQSGLRMLLDVRAD